jgi:hypothetical protein
MTEHKAARSVVIFKWLTIFLVLSIVGLFVWENASTFLASQTFTLNLYVAEPFTWSISLYLLLLIFTMVGSILGLTLMLRPHLRTRKALKEIKSAQSAPEASASSPTAQQAAADSEASTVLDAGAVEPNERAQQKEE